MIASSGLVTPRSRRLAFLAAVAALATAAALGAWAAGTFDRWEHQSVDARFEVRGERAPSDQVAVVAVDENTLATVNQRWPFPRDLQARFIDRLHAYHPRLIVYDVQLTEGSGDDDADFALYEAVSRARPVVLATAETDLQGRTRVFGGDRNVREAGAVVGSALWPLDDGTVRRFAREAGGLPSIATRAFEQLRGHPPSPDLFDGGSAWFDFAGGAGTVPRVSWVDVSAGRAPASALRDKIVVVGATAPRLGDQHATSAPGDGLMPGAEVHANAIATLLAGTPLESAPGWLDALLIVLLSCLVPLLAMRWSLRALIAAPVAAALFLVAAQLAFNNGTVVAVVYPMLGLVLSSASSGVGIAAGERAERRQVRSMFTRFVPESVVDQAIARAGADLRIGGEELDATVLFCDLRGFTSWAEKQEAPRVLDTLNVFLTEMSDAVLAHEGTVVAYLGDGLMAVFGAPIESDRHADQALAAAREMLGERLRRVNGSLEGGDFRLGIGLNSGPVMSGNVGSTRRVEYTAVGDTTNVASRIESMTKETGTALLLSAATAGRLADPTSVVPLGELPIRGRREATLLFTLPELAPAPSANPERVEA
jgi:adenylate cyclase